MPSKHHHMNGCRTVCYPRSLWKDCPACEAERSHGRAMLLLRAADEREAGQRCWYLDRKYEIRCTDGDWVLEISGRQSMDITREMARRLLGMKPGT